MSADGSLIDRSIKRPSVGEAPFLYDEIFFSRTDERGVIQAFNEVFVRIANYPAERLAGAPHRIIRHPDMPKGMFWLIWHQIKRGSLAGAYVKNRAEDGLHYWVYAMMQPIAGGFLSVRIKPSSDYLPKVEQLYAKILERERAGDVTPEQSARLLLAGFQDLGWRNYAAFEADAISAEYLSRRKNSGLSDDPDVRDALGLLSEGRKQRGAIRELNGRFSGANLLTINMRVIATRLTTGQKTISEIAKNYGIMVDEIKSHLSAFQISMDQDDPFVATSEAKAVFRMCSAKLLREAAEKFRSEPEGNFPFDRNQEILQMDRCATVAAMQSEEAFDDAYESMIEMRKRVEHLRRLIVGLSIVRIACRVESGILNSNSEGLSSIVVKLDRLQDEISQTLDKIEQTGEAGMEHLRRYRLRTNPESWQE